MASRVSAAAPTVKSRWKSPLLWTIFAGFLFLSLGGFAIFFARPWVGEWKFLSNSHTLVGLALLAPYGWYQLQHYRRVQRLHAQVHYKLGLYTFWSYLVTAVSGAWMVDEPRWWQVDLVHILASFAFLIFLTAHLILVIRVRSGSSAN